MHSRLRLFSPLLLLLLGVALPVSSNPPPAVSDTLAMAAVSTPLLTGSPLGPEDLLLQAITTFRAGNVDGALNVVESLISSEPNYRLAHLVHGDLLAARAGIPLSVDRSAGAASGVNNLLAEARQRWNGRTFVPGDRLPAPLLKPGVDHETIVFVDLAISRLFMFENRQGSTQLVGDYYVSAGKNGVAKRRKGDKKTPLGVYFVTERLPGETLPDKYGPVAFPVSYPNEWDARNGRTGSGIWLHGIASDTYSRPPLDSDGCVALTNNELSDIAPNILPGSTPVVIGYNIPWLESVEIERQRLIIEAEIENWRRAWESGDTGDYLDFYASEFQGRGMGKSEWSAYKRRVNAAKKFMQIDVSDVSVFGYPDEADLVVVTFEQAYKSDNFNSTSRKRQYWRLGEDGRWRIVSEGAAGAG